MATKAPKTKAPKTKAPKAEVVPEPVPNYWPSLQIFYFGNSK